MILLKVSKFLQKLAGAFWSFCAKVQVSAKTKKLTGILFKVFVGDIYGDHAVSCAGIIGIKHRHNVVRNTLSTHVIVLGFQLDGGLDGCVNLNGSSPLTQTGMIDFVHGRAVIDAALHKRGKYMAKCAAIGYGFLPFSFSSLGELEAGAVILLKRIDPSSFCACYVSSKPNNKSWPLI
nr:hypothetical protein [Tanacetum cinerariifolium]